ncbi:DUF6174 domain-containing protein [Deinococcus sp.]|uniref:DUF6174 domain-containing protein n=1 Tax=Deinococcus sp. TaxID=47478 RepID=UPI003C7BFF66
MKRLAVLALLAVLPAVHAGGSGAAPSLCGSSPFMDIAGVRKRLMAAEALWQKRGPARYALTTRFSGVWMRFKIEVQVADQIVGRTTTDQLAFAGQPIPPPLVSRARPEEAQRYTVPGLFAVVHSALKSARAAGACGVLNVHFAPHDGHVLSFQNDSSGVIDDEFLLTTSPLTLLP